MAAKVWPPTHITGTGGETSWASAKHAAVRVEVFDTSTEPVVLTEGPLRVLLYLSSALIPAPLGNSLVLLESWPYVVIAAAKVSKLLPGKTALEKPNLILFASKMEGTALVRYER